MTDEKTPPTGTPRAAARPTLVQVPTISSVYNLLVGCAGQIALGRTDVENLRAEFDELRKTLTAPEVIRVSSVPTPDELGKPSTPPPSASTAPARRDSLVVAAAKGGWPLGKFLLIAGGGLAWAASIAKWMSGTKPEYAPIAEALFSLARMATGQPP